MGRRVGRDVGGCGRACGRCNPGARAAWAAAPHSIGRSHSDCAASRRDRTRSNVRPLHGVC
eukprot:3224540-Prymnesium_polylepis.1